MSEFNKDKKVNKKGNNQPGEKESDKKEEKLSIEDKLKITEEKLLRSLADSTTFEHSPKPLPSQLVWTPVAAMKMDQLLMNQRMLEHVMRELMSSLRRAYGLQAGQVGKAAKDRRASGRSSAMSHIGHYTE